MRVFAFLFPLAQGGACNAKRAADREPGPTCLIWTTMKPFSGEYIQVQSFYPGFVHAPTHNWFKSCALDTPTLLPTQQYRDTHNTSNSCMYTDMRLHPNIISHRYWGYVFVCIYMCEFTHLIPQPRDECDLLYSPMCIYRLYNRRTMWASVGLSIFDYICIYM